MSEKHPQQQHESLLNHHEQDSSQEHTERLKNKIDKEATEASKQNAHEQLEQAKAKVESLADTAENIKRSTRHEDQKEAQRHVYSGDVRVSFDRTMTRVRKKLSVIERPLSRAIHNPIVDKVSEVAGQTVARPSSMLGGAFFSLIGTSALLWITNHYGYEYNYLAIILLFGVGMIVGLLVEGLLTIKKRVK